MKAAPMLALERTLEATADPRVLIFNEETPQQKMERLNRSMQAIQNRADSQNRELTAEEDREIDSLFRHFQIAEAENALQESAGLSRAQVDRGGSTRGGGRRSTPTPMNNEGQRRIGNDGAPRVTFNDVVNHPRIQEVASGSIPHSGAIPMPGLREMILNTITGEPPSDSPATTTQYVVQPRRYDVFGNDPRWDLSLLAALPIFPMTYSNSLEFPRLTLEGDDIDGDYQAHEAAEKAGIDLESAMHEAKVYTIAHWQRASRQVLSDVPLLQSQLASLLRYGVLRKTEKEFVNGSARIEGLLTVATPFEGELTAPADQIGEAAAALRTAGWNPNLVVLSPNGYFRIQSERTNDTGGHGYVSGGWDSPRGTIWGLRPVVTPALADDKGIILDSSAVAVLDRMAATLIVTSEGHTNVTRNLTTLLAEIRVGLAIFSPAAIKSVDFDYDPA